MNSDLIFAESESIKRRTGEDSRVNAIQLSVDETLQLRVLTSLLALQKERHLLSEHIYL